MTDQKNILPKDLKILEEFDKETLIEIINRQSALIEELREENNELRERIEELERSAKRPASPFRVEEKKRKKGKKKSGLKKGHKGYYRATVAVRFYLPGIQAGTKP